MDQAVEIEDGVTNLGTMRAIERDASRGCLRLGNAGSNVLLRESAWDMKNVYATTVGIGTGRPYTSDAMRVRNVRCTWGARYLFAVNTYISKSSLEVRESRSSKTRRNRARLKYWIGFACSFRHST